MPLCAWAAQLLAASPGCSTQTSDVVPCAWPAQLLAASVWLFRADIAVGFKAVAAPRAAAAAAAKRGGLWVPICMMYVPVGPETLLLLSLKNCSVIIISASILLAFWSLYP